MRLRRPGRTPPAPRRRPQVGPGLAGLGKPARRRCCRGTRRAPSASAPRSLGAQRAESPPARSPPGGGLVTSAAGTCSRSRCRRRPPAAPRWQPHRSLSPTAPPSHRALPLCGLSGSQTQVDPLLPPTGPPQVPPLARGTCPFPGRVQLLPAGKGSGLIGSFYSWILPLGAGSALVQPRGISFAHAHSHPETFHLLLKPFRPIEMFIRRTLKTTVLPFRKTAPQLALSWVPENLSSEKQ
ncbi:uncharacterized protein DKFZp434B061-like [Piliocolobus tephrosceles]|uniref:uncharacterized protein DKFZp434B061-like n=1 Tax=Piliocolobus tephrosceles TaxID=591936 RepID=UPI000E6B166D|nr:uncharacterized protein DKFZp434B061-like [Piliocolobus tephrosceles]